jgi:TolB-like protein/Tfp pilus assembly protein PilF
VRYLFENYTFDTDRRELRHGTEMIPLAPQVFDLLDYLIRNRERVVSKDELIRTVWDSRSISDAALTTRLNVVRRAIGDTGEKQFLIKTLPRKGFRFVGAVQEEKRGIPAEQTGLATRGGETIETPSSAPRLSIIVLPFANLSGDPEQDYFVDGVTESLTTDLSRISGSFVIGRHTAFTYRDKAIDLRRIGRELHIRYVLEGSVQRSSNRLRINVQLVDAETSNHLWAERFDKPIIDLFDMQDEIVSRLANALDAQLVAVEARRAERSQHPDALDLNFQGMAWLNKGPTPENMARARGFYERALALDPNNVEALVGMARVDVSTAASFLTDDQGALCARAEKILNEVLSIAPHHAFAHAVLGFLLIVSNRAARGIAECEQALALDRNIAMAHGWIGLAKSFMGCSAETEGHVQKALRLSPHDTRAHFWMMFVGGAKLDLGEDAQAVAWFRRGLQANRNHPLAHFQLAAALALLGQLDEARAAVQAGLALDPAFTLRRLLMNAPSYDPSYRRRWRRVYDAMRLAGVPEG